MPCSSRFRSPRRLALTGAAWVLCGLWFGVAVDVAWGAETDLTQSPTSVSFGNQCIAVTSAPTTVGISNTLTTERTVAVAVSGAHSAEFAATPASVLVPASGMNSFQVRFTPTLPGPRSAQVDLTFSGSDSPD